MKARLPISIVCLLFLLSCDPPATGQWTFGFTAYGKFNKTADVLLLGDTLRFTFTVPDTLYLQNGLGETKVEPAKPIGGFVGYKLYKIDTTIKTADLNYKENGIETFVNPGTTDVIGTPVFHVDQIHASFTLHMVLKKKGLYCFSLDGRMGGRYQTSTSRNSQPYYIWPKIAAADLHQTLGSTYLGSNWLNGINYESNQQAYYFWVK